MLVLAIIGGVVGWSVSRRGAWGLFLIVSAGLATLTVLTAWRFDATALVSLLAFWVAVESGWFLAQFAAERSLGDDVGTASGPSVALTARDWDT